MANFALTAVGMVNALGDNLHDIRARLFAGDLGRMSPLTLKVGGSEVLVGAVHEDLPRFPPELEAFTCRNNRLSLCAYQQIQAEVARVRACYGANRVGVVMGSSTAGLDASEQAFALWYRDGKLPDGCDVHLKHEMGGVSKAIAQLAGVTGPAYTVSTACSSSAKVFASAAGLLASGFCDAVITGGVDVLCHIPLNGFNALASLCEGHSLPMSRNRTGLNIGEGAALFVMTREQPEHGVFLRGVGESCDAYHMSAPHPEGVGAEAAMRAALAQAGTAPEAVHYLNLHGTGTPLNDAMESKAVARVFDQIPCSSTKPLIGHGLGMAGAMEVGFCYLALTAAGEAVPLPPHLWDGAVDERLPVLPLTQPGDCLTVDGPVRMMSNSFAFGGNNCSVLIERR
ncbi:beta-ketoacyl-ACP synthase [Acanthopleuribacter pedis]|uniref:Beta-ketoacyl-ACP synthase n=1 Tax=Acanthopleuribacter pedis TaxID=442870 RepID=A0A8J7Q8T4_9BACT|nr:beta-ketoacyl-ACP synthase [Acanthopleuribacter pedis]MBO1320656.1 beta-ketoacyl-ACP synthase [Acanthopleuribacter pedis]